jgi:hypothetical protein
MAENMSLETNNPQMNFLMQEDLINPFHAAVCSAVGGFAAALRKHGVTIGHDPRIPTLESDLSRLEKEKSDLLVAHTTLQNSLQVVTLEKEDLAKQLEEAKKACLRAESDYKSVRERESVQANLVKDLEKETSKLRNDLRQLKKKIDKAAPEVEYAQELHGGSSQKPDSGDEWAALTLSALTTPSKSVRIPAKPQAAVILPAFTLPSTSPSTAPTLAPATAPVPAATAPIPISSDSDREEKKKKEKRDRREQKRQEKEDRKRSRSPIGSDTDPEIETKKQKKDQAKPPASPAVPKEDKKRKDPPAPVAGPVEPAKKARSDQKPGVHKDLSNLESNGVYSGRLNDAGPSDAIFSLAAKSFKILTDPKGTPQDGFGLPGKKVFNTSTIKVPEMILTLKSDSVFERKFNPNEHTVLRECGTYAIAPDADSSTTFALCSKSKTSITVVYLIQSGLSYVVRDPSYTKKELNPPASGTKFVVVSDGDASEVKLDRDRSSDPNLRYVATQGYRPLTVVNKKETVLFVTAFLVYQLTKQNAKSTYLFYEGTNRPENPLMAHPNLPRLCRMASKHVTKPIADWLHKRCQPVAGLRVRALLDFIKETYPEQVKGITAETIATLCAPKPKKARTASSSSSAPAPSKKSLGSDDDEGDDSEDSKESEGGEEYDEEDSFIAPDSDEDDESEEVSKPKAKAAAPKEISVEDRISKYQEAQYAELLQWLEDNTGKTKVVDANAVTAFREKQRVDLKAFKDALTKRPEIHLDADPVSDRDFAEGRKAIDKEIAEKKAAEKRRIAPVPAASSSSAKPMDESH